MCWNSVQKSIASRRAQKLSCSTKLNLSVVDVILGWAGLGILGWLSRSYDNLLNPLSLLVKRRWTRSTTSISCKVYGDHVTEWIIFKEKPNVNNVSSSKQTNIAWNKCAQYSKVSLMNFYYNIIFMCSVGNKSKSMVEAWTGRKTQKLLRARESAWITLEDFLSPDLWLSLNLGG